MVMCSKLVKKTVLAVFNILVAYSNSLFSLLTLESGTLQTNKMCNRELSVMYH